MSGLARIVIDERNLVMRWGAVGLLVTATTLLIVFSAKDNTDTAPRERFYRAKVEHVRSGHKVKLDGGEKLNYAGSRAPYENERLYEESRRRNAELVEGRKVRLRFDDKDVVQGERLRAYAFVDGTFVNETLVREGLAYVRLTPDTTRFADLLLAAQGDARRHRRGLWRNMTKSSEASYPANIKHGNFHRPTCKDVEMIKPQRLRVFKNKRQAFAAGFAPCSKCLP